MRERESNSEDDVTLTLRFYNSELEKRETNSKNNSNMNGQSSIGHPPTLNGVNGVGMDVRDVVSILDNLTEENNGPPGPNGLFRKEDEKQIDN